MNSFILLFFFYIFQAFYETSSKIPNIFLSYNETQTLFLRDFFPKYFPTFEITNITNQFYSLGTSETLETIDDYSFISSPRLKKSKYVPEIDGLFLFFVEKSSIFFVEKKLDRFLEIRSNIKLKYSLSSFNESSNITCYDLIYLNQTGEIVFDCDLYYSNLSSFKTGFLVYKLDKDNRQMTLVNYTILNDSDPSRPGLVYLTCPRLIQLNQNKIYRRCWEEETTNLSSSFNYLEIYNLTFGNDSKAIIKFSDRINSNLIFTGNMTITSAFGLNNYRLLMVANNWLFLLQLYESPPATTNYTYKIIDSKSYSKEPIISLYLFGNRNANISQSLLLTKLCLYLINNTDPLQNNIKLLTNLSEVSTPIKVHYTKDYFLIEFNKFIKFYHYQQNGTDVNILHSFYHFFPTPDYIIYYVNILFIDNVESISILSKKQSSLHEKNETTWDFNITQILFRVIHLRYNEDILYNQTNHLVSMDISNITAIVNDQYIVTIPINFWNINETQAYFFRNTPTDSHKLLSNENLLINLEDYIVGPLMHANLIKTSPIKETICVVESMTYNLDSALNKFGFNPTNVFSSTIFLQIEANSNYFSILWQNTKDLNVIMIRCFEIKDDLVTDCMLLINYAMKNRILTIERSKNSLWIMDESKILYVLQEDNFNANITMLPNSPGCDDILISQISDVLFCLNHNRSYLDAYLIINNSLNFSLMNGDVFAIPNLYIDKLYIDLFEYNSLIFKSGSFLYFFEIVPNYQGNLYEIAQKDRSYSFYLKNKKMMKSNSFDAYIINKNQKQRKMIIVDYQFYSIEEYSLDYPTDIFFSRYYPIFGCQITGSIFNLNEYLGIICNQKDSIAFENFNSSRFMFLYDTEQQTSNLLKQKVDLETDRKKYNIKLLEDQMLYQGSSKIYAALLIVNDTTITIKTVENIKLSGTLKNIYQFPGFINNSFLTFSFRLYFYTLFSPEKIFYVLNITLIPKDTVITSPFLNTDEFLQMQSYYNDELSFPLIEKCENDRYMYIVPDNIFQGPINNYIYTTQGSNDETNNAFNAYLTPTLHFEDYHIKNEIFGDIVSMELYENVMMILSQKLLTFYDIDEDYRVIYQYTIPDILNCLSIEHHSDRYILVVFCQLLESDSTPALVIEIFDYNYIIYTDDDDTVYNITNNNNTSSGDFIYQDDSDYNDDYFEYNTDEYSFSVDKKNYENGDSELMDNNFVSSQTIGDHLLILAKEFYSFTNSIYIFQLPSDDNDDSLICKGLIQLDYDENVQNTLSVREKNFTVVDYESKIIDFEAYQSNKTSINDNFVIFGLLTLNENDGNYIEVKVNRSEEEECSTVLLQKRIRINFLDVIDFDEIILPSIELYSVSFLSVEENFDQNSTKITFLLTTNLEILELELMVFPNDTAQLKVLYSYRKFFSCTFVPSSPVKFQDFLGSFCQKDSEIKNYFLLYKKGTNQNESHPIRTLPILIDRFELLFHSLNNSYYLILPSYLNLYQEYSIDLNLTLIKSKKKISHDENFLLTAYNDLSNASYIIKFIYEEEEDVELKKLLWILLPTILGILAIVLLFIFLTWFRRNKKKRRVFNEEMISVDASVFIGRKKRDSMNSTMISSVTMKQDIIKEVVTDQNELKVKANPKSDRYSCEIQIQKKIRDFNKNF